MKFFDLSENQTIGVHFRRCALLWCLEWKDKLWIVENIFCLIVAYYDQLINKWELSSGHIQA